MKNAFIALVLIALLAPSALAHETREYRIGEDTYRFVVGSQNEPVTVDDKSGVEFTVTKTSAHDEENEVDESAAHSHAEEGDEPVAGLTDTLQVELIAGDARKTLPIKPTYGEEGSYYAPFYPTIATTLTYRIFGSINGTPVDLSFTCNPAGHPVTEEDTTETEVSPGVVQTLKRGAFGCPLPKADLGFPEPSKSIVDLTKAAQQPPQNNTLPIIAVAISCVAAVVALVAFQKRKR